MKSIGNKILAFAFMVALIGAASASVNPKVELVNYSISSVPAVPGQTVTLTLYLKSIEFDNCAERLSTQISTSYPLSVQGPDTQYIYELCANDTPQAGTLSFMLPVDPLASTGTYQVFVTTTYEKRFSKFTDTNTINVKIGGPASFVASVSSSNPVDIYPGDSATVTIDFQNNGSSTVQSARATMAAQSGISVKWAGTTQEIGQITPRGSASATFNIEADKLAQPGNYPLYVTLDYVSEDKSTGQSKFTFQLPLKPKADFSAMETNSSMLYSGQGKTITIGLTNTGTQEARKLKIRVQPYFPFSTDGTVRYVDSLAPGQTVPLDYTITVDKDATPGAQLLTLLIDYEDPMTKKFSDSADFSLMVQNETIVQQAMDLWYVWVAIAVIALIVFARRAMGQKQKQ